MAKQSTYTESGFQALKDQLEYLKNVKLPEITKEVGEARAQGDLSENAEYEEARDAQAKVSAQIQELEDTIAHAVVVKDHEIRTDIVNVGVLVTVKYIDDDEEESYELVGTGESSIADGKISDQSPIGKAIIGCKVDDVVAVDTPSGIVKVKITNISKPQK